MILDQIATATTQRAERYVVQRSVRCSPDAENLWAFLADYEAQTGGQILAIAHNGNGSNGAMFSDKTLTGKRMRTEYANTRMRWEPLYEVTQYKERWTPSFGQFSGVVKVDSGFMIQAACWG